jgi:hypothetical protein
LNLFENMWVTPQGEYTFAYQVREVNYPTYSVIKSHFKAIISSYGHPRDFDHWVVPPRYLLNQVPECNESEPRRKAMRGFIAQRPVG